MIRLVALLLTLLAAGAAAADGGARAERLLAEAAAALEAADAPRERLAALGRAAQAQEAALAALRVDLRALADRRAALEAEKTRRERSFRAVLSALERLERAPRLAVIAHPNGPVAAARAGMALASFAPALEAEAAEARALLDEIAALDAGRREAVDAARDSLAALQEMRTEIAALLDEDRRARRLPAEIRARLAAETAALADTASTLRALSANLPAAPTPGDARAAAPALGQAKGALPPPAEGVLVQPFGEAGREGVGLSVPAYAEIYAPWRGVVRFSGAFGEYETLVVLEPGPGVLFVMAGLGETWREAGETVLAGEPLGAMGGPAPVAEDFLIAAGDGEEALGRETLYIEVREGGAPVDPTAWFAFVTTEGDE